MAKFWILITCFLSLSVGLTSQLQAGTSVWGIDNISKINNRSAAPYTVFLGSYSNQHNALGMKARLRAKGYMANIKRKGRLYVVFIGPTTNLKSLRRLQNVMPANTPIRPVAKIKPHASSRVVVTHTTKRPPVDKDEGFNNNWFVQAQGGIVVPSRSGQFLIDNGSEYAPPLNVDIYSSGQSNQGAVALTVGKRLATSSSIIDHYSFGGRLHYVIPANVGGTITQYSLPQFLNYDYSRKLSALALTADMKLNAFSFAAFSPYVNGGLGVSLNQVSSYHETALAGVTARISPAYASRSKTQFTYHVGAGFDFMYRDNLLFSAGYEFEDFGNFASGNGQGTWAPAQLGYGSYHANTALLGVTHLID